MSGMNAEPNEYAENSKNAERFFLKTSRGAFLFAVTNDEFVQQDFNKALRFRLLGSGKTIHIHDWLKDGEGLYPAEQLRRIKIKYPDTAGLILTGLDAALEHDPNFFVQLNFGREALSSLGIPLLFWLSSTSLHRISFEAIDLYSQRAGTNLFFNDETTDADQATFDDAEPETLQAQENLRPVEARLKLLQQQLDEAEKQRRDPVDIANEIVLELLRLSIRIPGTMASVQLLMDRYYHQFDLERAEHCSLVAELFSFLGEAEKARLLREKAVEIKALKNYRELDRTNPQSYRPNVAETLGKLAGLQVALNDFSSAGRGYREALEIYRELARSKSSAFLSDVAATLGNLAQVDAAQNDFTSAEKGYQEALSLYRELAKANPSTYLPYVAATLNNLAKIQSTMNESTAALQGYQEALKITGELASAVTWLHVSDFHLTDGAPYDQEVILRSLVESVKRFRQEGHAPDLIFATGDIAKNGKAREYEQATQFFDALLKAAGLGKERLFIVPGNHDVDRKMGKGLLRTLESNEDADEYFDPETPPPHLTFKFQAFSAWFNGYFSGIRSFPADTTCSLPEVVSVRNCRVAILPLNSALFSLGDDDYQKLFIGRRCLDKAKKQLQVLESDVKIALLHHPLDWLSQVERSNIRSTLGNLVDLLLHGHCHETDTESIVSANGGYLKLAAGAAWQTRQWPNRALYATYYGNQVTIFPIRYEDTTVEKWTLDPGILPSPSYTRSFTIPGRMPQGSADARESIADDNDAVESYQTALREDLGKISLLGTHALENIPVGLTETFVSLHISETWRSDRRFNDANLPHEALKEEQIRTPEEVMRLVFAKKRLLLVIGDPGSGKTTLLKHYALTCLKKEGYKKLGFTEAVLPFFLPLRELIEQGSTFAPLSRQLFAWSETHFLDIEESRFAEWLKNRKTLILFDGLDEISDPEQRIRACGWIDRIASRFTHARVVVTSRATGYRKGEGIELASLQTRADIMDFTAEQQAEFLEKWFSAALLAELPPAKITAERWKDLQKQKALQKAKTIIEFLGREENKSLQTLARVPMLLQIMAILWKEREFLPATRVELYDAALNYILDYRDRQKMIEPLLPARDALRVLAPVSLWMQELLGKDEVARGAMQQQMQVQLDTLDHAPSASAFCKNLVDRAGLLVEYGDREYVFRHKSFREYMAGHQLNNDLKHEGRLTTLVEYFGNDWWEEPLRFFIGQVDAETFDSFMQRLFDSTVSADMTQKQQDLLDTLIREAPQKKIDALQKKLLDPATTPNRKRYLLKSLEGIGQFDTHAANVRNLLQQFRESVLGNKLAVGSAVLMTDKLGADYILIPGGTFNYSVTKKPETAPDLYVAKFTVTNRLYRRFISYLMGNKIEFANNLPVAAYREVLDEKARPIDGFSDYLIKGEKDPATLFRSRYDDDKRFNKDDQPVVGVSWYDARAYALWLSLLENNGGDFEHYRLPEERGWEYAAAGKEGRLYPWGNAEPTPKLANYDGNEGATTPVGRYPEGATPEGLYDMAGNVWEWCSDSVGSYRVLRGGYWCSDARGCRSAPRSYDAPGIRGGGVGFRLVFVP